jgi:uncharacterized protein (DUF433 family)
LESYLFDNTKESITMLENKLITQDPDILSGTPIFVNTRVPVQTLLDYLEGGHPLNE